MHQNNTVTTIATWVMVAIFLFPLIWLGVTSLRTTQDLFSKGIDIFHLTIQQYITALQEYNLSRYLLNSVLLSISVVVLNLLIGIPAAYGLTRYRVPFRSGFMFLLLIVRMAPVITLALPLFLVVSRVGLLDTLIALIVAHVAFKLPMTIWLLMISFQEVPMELEESAKLDGATNLQTLTRIALPLIRPGLGAAAIFAFILTWNDFLVALILTNSPAAEPVTVGMSQFLLQYGIDWGPLSAAGVMVLIPVIFFALIAGESLVKGLTQGAIKE